VWRWPEVAVWWQETLGEPVEQLQEDLFMTMLNGALNMRRTASYVELGDAHLAAIAAALPDQVRMAADSVPAE
jgi:hypothetical protein